MVKATKESLVQLTIQEISKHGYQNITLRKLANEIGATTGVVYSHFTNKEDLFAAVTYALSEQMSDKEEYNDYSDSTEAIIKIGEDLIKWYMDEPNLANFFFSNPSLSNVFNGNRQGLPFIDILKRHITNIKEQTGLHFNEQVLFIQFWSFVQGYIMLLSQHMTDPNPLIIRSTVKQFIGTIHP